MTKLKPSLNSGYFIQCRYAPLTEVTLFNVNILNTVRCHTQRSVTAALTPRIIFKKYTTRLGSTKRVSHQSIKPCGRCTISRLEIFRSVLANLRLNTVLARMGKNLLSRSSRKKSKGGGEDNSSSSSSRSEPSEPSSVSESLAGALHNREELEDVFKRFDANGDGKISSSELGEILRSMGCRVGPRELGLMMKEADADGDGFISLEEFIDLNTKGNDKAACLEDLKNAFKVFDLDRNGSISADELYQVLKGMGDGSSREDCQNMITGVDRNGDGLINFEEFKTMMTTSASSSSSK